MPRGAFAEGIIYNKNSSLIWLAGKYKGMISFDITKWNDTDPFIDYGDSIPFPVCSAPSGQSYIQRGNTMYCNLYEQLIQFDFQSATTSEIADGYTKSRGCFAIIDNYLIYTWNTTINIFNFETNSWIEIKKTMFEAREQHSCMVQPLTGYLYVMGGVKVYSIYTYFDSIEKLFIGDIDNINNYKWQQVYGTLSYKVASPRSVIHEEFIFVMGGIQAPCTCGPMSNVIDIIDTMSDAVFPSNDYLHEPMYGMMPVVVSDRIYIFGGSGIHSNSFLDYWQYYDIPDINDICDSCDSKYNPVCCGGVEYINSCQAFCFCNDTYIEACACEDDLDCKSGQFCNNKGECVKQAISTKYESNDGVYIVIGIVIGFCVYCWIIYCVRAKYNHYSGARQRREMEQRARQRREMVRNQQNINNNTKIKTKVKRLDDPPKPKPKQEMVTIPQNYHVGKDRNMYIDRNIEMIDRRQTESYSAMNCVICLDVLLDHEASMLLCGHKFHTHCIEEYNETKSECPLCRQEIVFQ